MIENGALVGVRKLPSSNRAQPSPGRGGLSPALSLDAFKFRLGASKHGNSGTIERPNPKREIPRAGGDSYRRGG
jgi:hypothetical protein